MLNIKCQIKGKSVPMCLFMGLDLETWVRNKYVCVSLTVLSTVYNVYVYKNSVSLYVHVIYT